MTVVYFGPLTCSIITTTRKFFTILASVILFANPISAMQWVGTVLVFLGKSLPSTRLGPHTHARLCAVGGDFRENLRRKGSLVSGPVSYTHFIVAVSVVDFSRLGLAYSLLTWAAEGEQTETAYKFAPGFLQSCTCARAHAGKDIGKFVGKLKGLLCARNLEARSGFSIVCITMAF